MITAILNLIAVVVVLGIIGCVAYPILYIIYKIPFIEKAVKKGINAVKEYLTDLSVKRLNAKEEKKKEEKEETKSEEKVEVKEKPKTEVKETKKEEKTTNIYDSIDKYKATRKRLVDEYNSLSNDRVKEKNAIVKKVKELDTDYINLVNEYKRVNTSNNIETNQVKSLKR